jgi:hypothetical protein
MHLHGTPHTLDNDFSRDEHLDGGRSYQFVYGVSLSRKDSFVEKETCEIRGRYHIEDPGSPSLCHHIADSISLGLSITCTVLHCCTGVSIHTFISAMRVQTQSKSSIVFS